MRRGLLATAEEIRSIKDRLSRRPFDAIYSALRNRCTLILESSPVTEAQWRALWEQGNWGSALNAARTTQGRIIDLLIAHGIDPNPAYKDRAVEELKNLISWTTWADPCHAPLTVDLCTAECAVAATVGLDWLWESITEPDRLRVLHALRHRVVEPYLKAVRSKVWWHSACNNWNAVVNSGCAMAGIALGDNEPAAQEVYLLAKEGLRHYLDALGREGGWDEGIGYWGFGMRYLLLMAEAADRTLDDAFVFHARGMDATGVFPIYFTPNGQAASFGDYPAVPLWGTLYLLVKHYGLKEVAWWLDTFAFHRDAATGGWPSAGLALLFRPADTEANIVPDLQPVKVFNEIGWAAMADHWPRPNLYAAIKTGDLSASHSQRDMNSLQLQVDGEMLLHDLGNPPYSRDYFSEGRGGFYEVQARGHNTIVLGDDDHRIDARGSIVEAQCGRNFRWVAANAGDALGEGVLFVRHAVMLLGPPGPRGAALIVVDELRNIAPEHATFLWHTAGKIQLDGQAGRITGKLSSMYFALAATSRLSVGVQTHEYRPGLFDNVLRGTTTGAKTIIASVFSRTPVKDKVQIGTAAGGCMVKVGAVALRFKAGKRHLQLVEVS